jgi:hypothetical protein
MLFVNNDKAVYHHFKEALDELPKSVAFNQVARGSLLIKMLTYIE